MGSSAFFIPSRKISIQHLMDFEQKIKEQKIHYTKTQMYDQEKYIYSRNRGPHAPAWAEPAATV